MSKSLWLVVLYLVHVLHVASPRSSLCAANEGMTKFVIYVYPHLIFPRTSLFRWVIVHDRIMYVASHIHLPEPSISTGEKTPTDTLYPVDIILSRNH